MSIWLKRFWRGTKTGKGLPTLALVCLTAFSAQAQDLNDAETAKLKLYDETISTANPTMSKAFLEDTAFADRLKLADPEKVAALIAKAQAVNDLEQLLDKPWRDNQEIELSRALSIRIDLNKPLEKVGIGPAPEPILRWMARYKRYSAHKEELVKRSIRQFEVVFGTNSTTGKSQWEIITIRERNAFLAEQAGKRLENYLENEPRTDATFQSQLRNETVFKYLDPADRGRYERYLTQLAAADAAKAKLSAPQLDKIKDQAIEQQMYLLGGLFDKSKSKGAISLERKVDSARQSKPGETLSFQNNQLLAGMLQTALVSEIKGTVAGDKVLKFYNSGAKLNIAIESCQGCYAKYEPSSGRIIFDSEMIQQYLRVNNLTAETLLKSKAQIAALARYASPIFVEEATHQMQHDWAAKAGIYKPYVQEDEVEANSMQALYTTEKMRRDAKFKALFLRMEKSTVYAQKRMETMDRFNESPVKFDRMIRQVYYYGTPSFEAASSQILSAVSSELERRKTLDAKALVEIEETGAGLEDAMAMTTQELTGSVAEIKTVALKKIQNDLLHKTVYTDHYDSASDWTGSMLTTVNTSRVPKPKVRVP